MPARIFITDGNTHDSKLAKPLLEAIPADYFFADKAYDTDAFLEYLAQRNIIPVIPPKKNRLVQRDYDKYLYKLRHLVENAFLHLKQWRGIATRFAKNTASFLAAVQCKSIMLWLKVF